MPRYAYAAIQPLVSLMRRFLTLAGMVIVAAALVGAAPPPDPNNQTNEAEATRDLAKAVEGLSRNVAAETQSVSGPEYEAPCDPGDDRRQSDLCAQWKAADAAREAARYALWSILIGGVSILGLGLNFWQTRKALKRAREANEIARKVGQVQTRAYVAVENAWLDVKARRIEFYTFNSGQSEAPKVRLWTSATVAGRNIDINGRPVSHRNGVMNPGSKKVQIIEIGVGATVALKKLIETRDRGTILCELTVLLIFTDAFGGKVRRVDKFNTCPAWGVDGRYPLHLIGGPTSRYKRTPKD